MQTEVTIIHKQLNDYEEEFVINDNDHLMKVINFNKNNIAKVIIIKK